MLFRSYHLLAREPGIRVAIVEPDPGHAHAASARSNGGVRILFYQAESIAMSQYGHEFYAAFPDLMAVDDEASPLDLYRHGYCLMATEPAQIEDMQANLELQRELGCRVEVHDAASLERTFPDINASDVLMAVRSPDDMWIDPYSAVQGLLRKARHMGTELIQNRVVGFEESGARIRAAVLEDGTRLTADWFVNTTGAWAPADRKSTRLNSSHSSVSRMPSSA